MNKLLVVEDEEITADLLRRYFEIMGYDVINALSGSRALSLANKEDPTVIILDINLPDMTGYDICRKLRATPATQNIPIIFLTSQAERRSRLSGLELGADDYITKPFNIEELRIKVHNIIERLGGKPLVDARTSLPSKSLIKERLPDRLKDKDSAFFYVDIVNAEAFEDKYGPVAQNQVVRSAARIIGDVLQTVEPVKSFVGHPEDTRFLIATTKDAVKKVEELLPKRFAEKVKSFYDYKDQNRGKMQVDTKLLDFMTLALVPATVNDLEAAFIEPKRKRPETNSQKQAAQKTKLLSEEPKSKEPKVSSAKTPKAPKLETKTDDITKTNKASSDASSSISRASETKPPIEPASTSEQVKDSNKPAHKKPTGKSN